MHDATPVAYASQPTETVRNSATTCILYVNQALMNPTCDEYVLYCIYHITSVFESATHTIIFIWFQINYVSAHDNETLFDIISLKVKE